MIIYKEIDIDKQRVDETLQCYGNVLNVYLCDIIGYVLMHDIIKLHS